METTGNTEFTEYNGVMMQYFHWYTPGDGSLWNSLAENAPALAAAGVTSVWLPPAYKGADGAGDVGYAVYDLFDLGEFDQKGSIRTKYGTRDEYLAAIRSAQAAGIQVYADVVFNHKLGADHEEEFLATPFDPEDRKKAIGRPRRIRAWTGFTFPGRAGRYSQLHWHWWHFNAADHNALDDGKNAVYLFEGKKFDRNVDREKGNFDYLMGCNLDINNPDVQQELLYWGEWLMDTTGVDGFRFDAVKHVKPEFFLDWLRHVRACTKRDLFAVGEYWSGEIRSLERFIEATAGNLMLFDVGLHYNFAEASKQVTGYDLRRIFENTLVKEHPTLSVTLVSNHDSQPLQALESVVEGWFKPLAYALILLRRDGYPCVFAADYYGAHYRDTGRDGEEHEIWMDTHRRLIDTFLHARRACAYGEQRDYFDDPVCIGWTRAGNQEHPGGMAVVLTSGGDTAKVMQTSSPGTTWVDLTDHIGNRVETDEHGLGRFPCRTRSISVWVPESVKLA